MTTEAELPTRRRSRVSAIPLLVGIGLYVAVLQYSYMLIAPTYGYQGLRYRTPDTIQYATVIAMVAAVALLLPRRIVRVSDFMQWVIFIAAGASSMLIGQYANILPQSEASTLALNVGACLLLIRVISARGPRGFLNFRPRSPATFWILIGIFSVLVYTYLASAGALSLRYLNIYDVYTARAEFVSITKGNALIGYALPIQYYVINPLMLAYGLRARRTLPIVLAIVGQLAIYSSNGYKTVLFSLLVVPAIHYLCRTNKRAAPSSLLKWVGLGGLAILIVDKLTGSIALTVLLIRRFMIIPGALTSAYVSIFDDLDKTHFFEIIPGISNPYTSSPTTIVGGLFLGNGQTSANVNLFGHGFVSYGYTGMYIEAAIFAVLLWLADDATRGLPLSLACAMFAMPAESVAEASVFTASLTHAILAAILIALFMPRDRDDDLNTGQPRST